MSDPDGPIDDSRDDEDNVEEEESGGGPEFILDILSGNEVRATPKKQLVQRILHQLIESYGFDRNDIRAPYRLTTQGKRGKTVDIAILRHGVAPSDENVERIIVCQTQKTRDMLRSPNDAAADLRVLQDKMQLLPSCHLGMWTSGQEDFFIRSEDTKFETRFTNIGVWPAPGEGTERVFREGGVTQVPADPEDLEVAFGRCHQYLAKNLQMGHETFKQFGLMLLAKLFDEARPLEERQFWIAGEEPFVAVGQAAIRARVMACLDAATAWQPTMLRPGWVVDLEDPHVARLATELARYSLADTLPLSRIRAFRSAVRSTMDGREGRYPTPLNVAEMAVRMLDPGPKDRVFDCSSGTGTFLAMAAAHLYEKAIQSQGVNLHTASTKQLNEAQFRTAAWAKEHLFGCDMDPDLVVASRLNVLLAAGHPGSIFRIDARMFPEGELEDLARARDAIPERSMDIVLTNPWFSTKDTIRDEAIVRRHDLGKVWNRTEDGQFVNTGDINPAGVPPEVLFLERAWRWTRPGTGRIGILLPDGVLGNPACEYIRWWILRYCEVLASVDLPIEPFKVALKEYKLTPALPSLLVLRRRDEDELKHVRHPDYWVFMAIVHRAGVDARGNHLFDHAPDGQELIFEEETTERVRVGGRVESRSVQRRSRHIADELPDVASHYQEFIARGRTAP